MVKCLVFVLDVPQTHMMFVIPLHCACYTELLCQYAH